jgi:hypothetical protein
MALEARQDALHHTRRMKSALGEIKDHLREDIAKINEPRAMAMFETSAEVIDGLCKAFDDYERRNEPAWVAPP